MCRYFSHIQNGDVVIKDQEGDDLAEDAAAIRLAHEVMEEIRERPDDYPHARWSNSSLLVVHEAGRRVAKVSFWSAHNAPGRNALH